MKAVLRPTLLRQCQISVPAAGTLTRIVPSSLVKTSSSRLCPFPPNFPFVRSRFVRDALPISTKIAAFHTSTPRAILPAGPQRIEGTANDAAPVPDPSPTHGSYHWTFERLISAALIPLTIAPFAAGSLNPVMDAALCATIIIHSHIGFESIIIDYVPIKRLPKTRALFWWGLRAATLGVAVGLYEFETNDVGLTEAVKRIWTA